MSSRRLLVLTAGLAALAALGAGLASCGERAADERATAAPAEHEHGHAHLAPHGGTLVELGEEAAHLELLVDAASGRLDAWVLDAEAEQYVRIAQAALVLRVEPPESGSSPLELRLEAVASALTGETVGDSSRFAGTLPAPELARGFRARLESIELRGQTYRGVEFRYPQEHHR